MKKLLILFLTFTLYSCGANPALAHDGWERYKNFKTGFSCCNDKDCRFIPKEESDRRFKFLPNGDVLVDGKELFKKEHIHEGHGDEWGICEIDTVEDAKPYHIYFCIIKPGVLG